MITVAIIVVVTATGIVYTTVGFEVTAEVPQRYLDWPGSAVHAKVDNVRRSTRSLVNTPASPPEHTSSDISTLALSRICM